MLSGMECLKKILNLWYTEVMRIAIFTDLYEPWATGGIISSIKAQKTELERQGHEVIVFCPGFESRDKTVIAVPTHRLIRVNGAVITKRPSLIEQYVLEKFPDFASFDVVHVQYEASCSIAGIRLAKKFNLPLVQTMHGREDIAIATNVAHPFKYLTASALNWAHGVCLKHTEKVDRDIYQAPTATRAKMWTMMINHANQADVVTAPSRHFADKLRHYGVEKPVVVVSNGVSNDLANSEVKVRKLNDGDTLKMIWNSRVSKEKRMMSFLQTLMLLERPYILYVYGDGNELKQAEKFAKDNQLKVKFYGVAKREKIFEKMREAHLSVVVSYNFDVQPMTLLEAEAMGLPVFICDPALREVVVRGGYLMADNPTPKGLAEAINKMPAEKIEQMSEMMLKSRANTAQEAQTIKMLAVYEKAIRLHSK